MKTILSALLGALFGFAIPYVAKIWERITRSKRMKSAVFNVPQSQDRKRGFLKCI